MYHGFGPIWGAPGPGRSSKPPPLHRLMLSPIHISCSHLPLLCSLSPRRTLGVGGSEMACGHSRRPRKKNNLAHNNFPHRAGSRGASRSFPRQTLPHSFHHRGCIPRGFSCVLVSAPLPDDGFSPLPRQPVLSISLTFTPLNPQVCVLGSPSGPFRPRHHHHGRSPRPRRLVVSNSVNLHQ